MATENTGFTTGAVTATPKTTIVNNDRFLIEDSEDSYRGKFALASALPGGADTGTLVPVTSGGTATQYNLTVNSAENGIDSAAYSNVITAVNTSYIGSSTEVPTGETASLDSLVPGTGQSAFTVDTGYVSGAAVRAAISGGYDHVNNQGAGTIAGGGHNFLHSGGGAAWQAATAYNEHDVVTNDSGKIYLCIVGGTSAGSGGPTGSAGAAITDNTVTWLYLGAAQTGTHGTISGGSNNLVIFGDYCTIGSGTENFIASTGATIGGGVSNVIYPLNAYSTIAGGGTNQIAQNCGAATITGGRDNVIEAGASGAVIAGGRDCVADDRYQHVSGRFAHGKMRGALVHTAVSLDNATPGNCQTMLFSMGEVLTDTSTVTLKVEGTAGIAEFPNDCSVVGRVHVQVWNPANGNANYYAWDFAISRISSASTVKVGSGAQTALGTPDLTMTADPSLDVVGNDFEISMAGVAATTLNATATITLTYTE